MISLSIARRVRFWTPFILAALALAVAACGGESSNDAEMAALKREIESLKAEQARAATAEVIKEVVVEKEVVKEVQAPVEVIKEVKEVVKEIPVEVIKEVVVEKEVVKEIPVEVEVPVEVIKEVVVEVVKETPVEVIRTVVVTATPPDTPTPRPGAGGQQPFHLDWDVSDSTIEAGESFTLSVRMSGVQRRGEHGGVSVSFPSLITPGGGDSRYSSSLANVEALDYTAGLYNVAFHQPGATIYRSDNVTRFSADYLLVESDDPSWPAGSDRTLRLRVTPKRAGAFRVQVRGWICAYGYLDCSRSPTDGSFSDQQGWSVERTSVTVAASAAYNPPTPAPPSGRIAFTSKRDGGVEIYVMNADGSGQTRLTYNEAWDHGPSWSPDGRRIAFTSVRDGGKSEIYVMNADGSGQTRLTYNEALDFSPSWSPATR